MWPNKHLSQAAERAAGALKAWVRSYWRTTYFSPPSRTAAARARARELKRSLSLVGLPQNDVSQATPTLAGSFAEAERQRFVRRAWLMPLLVIVFLPIAATGFGGPLFFPANWLFPAHLDHQGEQLAKSLYFTISLALIFVSAFVSDKIERPIMVAARSAAERKGLGTAFLMVLAFLLNFLWNLSNAWSQPEIIWLAMTAAGVGILWSAIFWFAMLKISLGSMGTGIGWRSPDISLILVLADAYTGIVAGGTGSFRSFPRRSAISSRLRVAARLLEGPMIHMLAGGDRAAEAVVRPPLEAAAAGLRQKLAWLATPTVATREELARSLGEALIAAATGHLAGLTGSEPFPASASTGVVWKSRLVVVWRWSVLALGPAAALWLSRSLIPDAARGIAVQFAALCFVVATFSILDPTGQDKLSSIVSAGTTLFGWGKPRA